MTNPIIQAHYKRGFFLLPISGKTKKPTMNGFSISEWSKDTWQFHEGAAHVCVNEGGNIAVLLGPDRSGVVVVDLDIQDGCTLSADDFPPTPTVASQSGGLHLYFRYTGTTPLPNNNTGAIGHKADFKTTGGYCLLPGSNKPYEWLPGKSPEEIPYAELPKWVVKCLSKSESAKPIANTPVRVHAGTNKWCEAMLRNMSDKLAKCGASRNSELNSTALILGHYCPQYLAQDEIEAALIVAMDSNGAISDDGMAATRATIRSGIEAGMREPKHPPESPKASRPQEVSKIVAVKDPVIRQIVLKNGEPRTLAAQFLYTCDSRSLAFWMDSFWEYSQGAYQKVKDASVDVKIRNGLEGVYVPVYNAKEDEWEDKKLTLKNSIVSEVFGAVKALDGVYLNENCDAPMWRDGRKENPRDIFTARNGLLNMKTGEFSPHDASYFCLGASDFDFVQDAKCPNWEAWLQQVFIKDPTQIKLLQEWFGYCLTYDCSQRKVMLLLGITTSGKGTILNILSSLLGRKNMVACEPIDTTDRWFGATVFGKRLVNFFDLRMGGRLDTAAFGSVILKLAEGAPTKIENKGKDIFTAPTVAKVTIASNNLPRFIDSSSAVAGRFLSLRFTESFLGKEDKGLDARLTKELPGIFIWAMAGLERLQDNGWRWTIHEAGEQTREQMADECSPVKRFVDEECVLDQYADVDKKTLFIQWQKYCKECNIQAVGTNSIFATQLHDAFPQLKSGRKKVDGKAMPRTHDGIRIKYEHEK